MRDLVLVHGFSLDARMWEPLARALSPQVRVHALDLPGSGTSRERPASTIDEMADALQAYVTSKGLTQFSLGGLSMGGYVVLAWWRRHSAGTRPASIVLMHTRASADAPEVRRQREETAGAVRREGTLEPFAGRMIPRLCAATTPGPWP